MLSSTGERAQNVDGQHGRKPEEDTVDTKDMNRRVLLAGAGVVAVAGLAACGSNASAGTPDRTQEILDKIARTDAGFGEACEPVQAQPASATAMFSIAKPGSFYLTQNIVAAAGMHGIEVLAPHVVIDLNGYSVIAGPNAAGLPAGTGIAVKGEDVTIYNGSVVGPWDLGVNFEGALRGVLWDVAVHGASSAGIVGGDETNIYDCECYGVTGTGFSARGSRGLVEHGGAWGCGTGFAALGAQNLFVSNCATACTTPFALGSGNSWGPICNLVGVGDISTVLGSSHPDANNIF
jgi:hypothetical protein